MKRKNEACLYTVPKARCCNIHRFTSSFKMNYIIKQSSASSFTYYILFKIINTFRFIITKFTILTKKFDNLTNNWEIGPYYLLNYLFLFIWSVMTTYDLGTAFTVVWKWRVKKVKSTGWYWNFLDQLLEAWLTLVSNGIYLKQSLLGNIIKSSLKIQYLA